jgi:type II secretory pathway component PulF
MLFADRISLAELAGLCRRLAIGTASGIDVRNVWRRETERGSARWRAEATRVHEAISSGGSVGDAIAGREYFPAIFRKLVGVGEQTGNLAEVYKRLADNYDYQISLRRSFLASLTWPAIQLTMAVLIIGGLIWAMGAIASMSPGRKPIDPLGLGLIGTQGVLIYGSVVGAMIVVGIFVVRSVSRGALWTKPLRRLAYNLPVIGKPLRTIALSRLSWTLQLAMNSAMEIRQTLRLALDASGNPHFSMHANGVVNAISQGKEIHEALRGTRVFPEDFVDAVEVAEHSGALVESLERLSRQYEEQANSAMRVLTTVAGFAVWALVAALIVTAIFRIFFLTYYARLQDAMDILK